MFSVGQKVVCVNDDSSPLVKGNIYTVLETVGMPEFVNVDCWALGGPNMNGWYASRFRPLTERKTSIEVFQRMLTPKKVDEHV